MLIPLIVNCKIGIVQNIVHQLYMGTVLPNLMFVIVQANVTAPGHVVVPMDGLVGEIVMPMDIR